MIKINDLAFSYGKNSVLENITTNLEPGRIYGLLGENGVGKTSLLTLLAGLKKPTSGSIDVDGFNPFDRKPSFLEKVQYLPEDVASFREKAIDFARSRGKFWPDFSERKFLDVMAEFEMDPVQKMSEMSAGQLKKTHISFTLACNARYILLDEPTNALDIPSKAQFRKAVTKYTSEDSVIVISTHQVRDLENIIDPIIILDRQDVLVNASLEEISSKLYFDYGTTIIPGNLYSEQLPGSFVQVLVNADGRDSKVSIEALFNAVHRNKELIKNLLKK